VKFKFFLLLLFFTLQLTAQEYFTSTEAFKRAHIGILVIDPETGQELYTSNADQYFIPASLQKIVSSAAAIAMLGDDYRFQTDLEYDGTIEQGILHGNLWIRGGGDPTLSLDIFSKWQEALEHAGIKQLDGKIIVDTSCFETALASPYWLFEDLGNYFGAGASALTINRNLYRITFQPGAHVGDPAIVVKTDPPMPHLTIYNEVTTGPAGSGDQAYVFGSEYSPVQFYRGTIPIDAPIFTIKAAIPDPALFCAKHLSQHIMPAQGIEMIRTKHVENLPRKSLYQHRSAPLGDLLREMNAHSINIDAEHLFKALGAGTAQRARSQIEKYLKDLGIPALVKDGAGLARNNLITPRGYAVLLSLIRKSPLYAAVYDSFPEAGCSGTLKGFPKLSKTRLRAKDGSMSNNFNMGGYLTLPSGRELIFCIFCNHYTGSSREIKEEIYHFLNEVCQTALQKPY